LVDAESDDEGERRGKHEDQSDLDRSEIESGDPGVRSK
jgi:hypothetical protein